MSVWDREEENWNEKYIMECWGSSPIDWQQQNRNILNEAITTYNKYVHRLASLNEVKNAVYYAEDRLKNECGDYMEDIERMKENVDDIESERMVHNS